MRYSLSICFLFVIPFVPLHHAVAADELALLAKSLTFHAPFDKDANAAVAQGDASVYTAESLKREKVRAGLHSPAVELIAGGKFGRCLSFKEKTNHLVFYKGAKNVPYAKESMNVSVSMWMQLDPAQELPPGYVDPLQITDKKWNDAAIFLDFTQKNPRQFRLGVFSDFKFWNPKNRKVDDIPDSERPLVALRKLPFQRTKWTHVCFTLQNFNRGAPAVATLYMDGKPVGSLERPQRYSWSPDDVVVMLGIYYVGRLDDFAIFKKSLSAAEVEALYALPKGIGTLTN